MQNCLPIESRWAHQGRPRPTAGGAGIRLPHVWRAWVSALGGDHLNQHRLKSILPSATLLLSAAFAGPLGAQSVAPTPLAIESTPVVAPVVAVEDGDSAYQRFRRAKNRFEFGDCVGALEELAGLDAPEVLKDEKQLLEVHQMRGICFALGENPQAAAHEFERLLHISPQHELDPFLTPPAVVDIFAATKTRIREEIERLKAAQAQQEQTQPEALRVVWVERELERQKTPLAAVFLPFGLAQWANAQEGKAIAIGGVQLAALAANVASYWAMQGIKSGEAPTAAELTAYRSLQTIQAGALVVTLGAYLYGVADAWWNYEPVRAQVIAEQRQELTGQDARESLRRLAP